MEQMVKDFIRDNSLAVVHYFKPECPYCIYLHPHFEALKDFFDPTGAIGFLSVDITDESRKMKNAFDFETVPMVIYYKDGNEVFRTTSRDQTVTTDDLIEAVKRFLLSDE